MWADNGNKTTLRRLHQCQNPSLVQFILFVSTSTMFLPLLSIRLLPGLLYVLCLQEWMYINGRGTRAGAWWARGGGVWESVEGTVAMLTKPTEQPSWGNIQNNSHMAPHHKQGHKGQEGCVRVCADKGKGRGQRNGEGERIVTPGRNYLCLPFWPPCQLQR